MFIVSPERRMIVSTKMYYNLYYYCSQHNTHNIYCDVCTECIMLLFTRSCPLHKIADHVLAVVVLSPHASLTVRINLVKRAIFTSHSNRICGRDDQKKYDGTKKIIENNNC